jgi:hypothetical protein
MPYFTQTRIRATCDAGIVEPADGGGVSIGGAAVPFSPLTKSSRPEKGTSYSTTNKGWHTACGMVDRADRLRQRAALGIAAAFATSSACGGSGEGQPPRTGSEFERLTRGDFGVNSASAACRARAIRSRLSGYRLPRMARSNPGRRGG